MSPHGDRPEQSEVEQPAIGTGARVTETIGASEVEGLVEGLAGQIAAALDDAPDPCLIGIRRRGDSLAQRLGERLRGRLGADLPLASLDITLYRDDFDSLSETPVVGQTEITFPLGGRTVVLVDDVLFTGRTVRAALDEILEFGRPARVMLAVLVDRGWRELPIAADFVGLRLETAREDDVQVLLEAVDGRDAIQISRAEGQGRDD
jgi:pyrimidine operon attenuation protein / uracil phosphoribosyltransferase